MSNGFTVKIWYASGAYEQAGGAPEETAQVVYEEAVANPRVSAAEVHGPTGVLLDSFRESTSRLTMSSTASVSDLTR